MTASQLVAVLIPTLATMAGGFWRVIALLLKLAAAVEAVPALTAASVDHDQRLKVLERTA